MINEKHKKKPWYCQNFKIHDCLGWTDDCCGDYSIGLPEDPQEKNICNIFDPDHVGVARRLVECWNACAGIENPLDLRRQRDELREALENMVNYFKKGGQIYNKREREHFLKIFLDSKIALEKTKESV